MKYFSQDFWRQVALSGLFLLFMLIGVGITSVTLADVEGKSILDLSSTTKGFLPPRMTTQNRNDIVNPTPGLLIYNTDKKRLEYFIGPTASDWFPGSIAAANQKMPDVPSGAVIYWADQEVPTGWQRCDGSVGTPNLEKSFVAGHGGGIPGILGSQNGDGSIGILAAQRQVNNQSADQYVSYFRVTGTDGADRYMNSGASDSDQYQSPPTIPPFRNLYYLCKI